MVQPEASPTPEVFNPNVCVHQTLSTVKADLVFPLANDKGPLDVERRYFGADVYQVPDRRGAKRHIRQVDAYVGGRANEWMGTRAEHMEEDFAAIGARGEDNGHKFGQALMARADELGLARRVPLSQLRDNVTLPRRVRDIGQLGNTANSFIIGATTDATTDEVRLLLCTPAEDEGGERMASVADLDALHVADPHFVKERIVDYHATMRLGILAHQVVVNQSTHTLPAELVAPFFIAAAAQEPTMAEQQYALDQALTTLRWLISLPPTEFAYSLIQRFADVRMRFRTSQSGVYLTEWAKHRRECAAEPTPGRDMAHSVLWAVEATQTVEPVPLNDIPNRDKKLLGHPTSNVRNVLTAEGKFAAQETVAAQSSHYAALFHEAAGLATAADAVAFLRERAPEALERVEQVDRVLTENSRFTSVDGIVEDIVRHRDLDGLSGKTWSAQDLLDEISRSFGLVMREADATALGLRLDKHRGLARLNMRHDPNLALALPIIIAARIKERLADPGLRSVRRAETIEAGVAQATQLLEGLAEYHQNDAATRTQLVASLKEARITVDAFLQENNITYADLWVLEGALHDSPNGEGPDYVLYDVLFRLLYLAKRGVIKLSLPIHRLVLHDLYQGDPQRHERIERLWPAFSTLA